jgi:hypothetical protein
MPSEEKPVMQEADVRESFRQASSKSPLVVTLTDGERVIVSDSRMTLVGTEVTAVQIADVNHLYANAGIAEIAAVN